MGNDPTQNVNWPCSTQSRARRIFGRRACATVVSIAPTMMRLLLCLWLHSMVVYSQPVFQRVFGPDPFDNLNNFVFKTSTVSLFLLPVAFGRAVLWTFLFPFFFSLVFESKTNAPIFACVICETRVRRLVACGNETQNFLLYHKQPRYSRRQRARALAKHNQITQ